MADSLSDYLAGQIIDWLADDSAFDAAPGTLWVSVFDDTDTERDGDFADARKDVAAADWTVTDTQFENANQVSLGEATADVDNITDIAIFDAETGGNLLLRVGIDDAPFNASEGTELRWEAGDITFDAVEFDA